MITIGTGKTEIAGYDFQEWEALKSDFENDKEKYRTHCKSFNELMCEVLNGDSVSEFCIKTGLGAHMFNRLKKYADAKDPVEKATIMSVAIGYHLDINLVLAILDSMGTGFNKFNDRDYAYTFILTRCRDKDIDECNEILKDLNIPKTYWLGSKSRDNDD